MKQGNNFSAEEAIFEIWDEISRDRFTKHQHRLHAVLLVFQGFSQRKVAKLFGDSPGNVGHWVRKYKKEGIAGLLERGQTGRPSTLNPEQKNVVAEALNETPSHYNLEGDKWDGKQLSFFVKQHFNIDLGVRQCQRLIRSFKSK